MSKNRTDDSVEISNKNGCDQIGKIIAKTFLTMLNTFTESQLLRCMFTVGDFILLSQ